MSIAEDLLRQGANSFPARVRHRGGRLTDFVIRDLYDGFRMTNSIRHGLFGLFRRTHATGDNRDVHGSRIYLAARFARREELRAIAEELRAAGASVTSRWLNQSPLGDSELGSARAATLAEMDFGDLRSADVCIAFTESGDGSNGRGGRHAELGIALALNLRVIVVGPREHVFHCLPAVEQFPDWEEARQALVGPITGQPSIVAHPLDQQLAVLR